ncbi:MAG: sulfite oxidase-like oxidoreductase [Gemmataceae bacterium]|nr:sulfite oxidase-like oxidoreductase [Gemmataceae bacterium]
MNESDSTIISPDTKRDERIPPGQVQTKKWPVLHYGSTPSFDRTCWTFHIFGLVETPWHCSYDEFTALPKIKVFADMHCVTRWSTLDNLWEGVSTHEVLSKVKVAATAKYVMVHCEHGFTTNLPLADFLDDDCLFAWKQNGVNLDADHGYPLRLVIPRLYAWKSAKWVRGIELMADDKAGFWEEWDHGGYHMRGDPWHDERFR